VDKMTFKATKQQVKAIMGHAFPEYKGRKFSIEFANSITLYNLGWDGGSKNEYVALDVNAHMLPIGGNYQFDPLEGKTVRIPADIVIVQHTWFCGQDAGIRIWANPVYLPRWLKQG
jgi:hypothetical protein